MFVINQMGISRKDDFALLLLLELGTSRESELYLISQSFIRFLIKSLGSFKGFGFRVAGRLEKASLGVLRVVFLAVLTS